MSYKHLHMRAKRDASSGRGCVVDAQTRAIIKYHHQILSSLKPLTSKRPVPLVVHCPVSSADSSASSSSLAVPFIGFLKRPPGMTIFPALPARGFGRPSAFRCRRVRGFSVGGGEMTVMEGGGGDGAGEERELVESAEDPEADRLGVSGSWSPSTSMSASKSVAALRTVRIELRVRFALPCDMSE